LTIWHLVTFVVRKGRIKHLLLKDNLGTRASDLNHVRCASELF